MKVRQVMTTDIFSINKGEEIAKAAEIMRSVDIGALPIHDGKKIVGMVTDRDIVIRNVARRHGPNIPCEEVMTPKIISCSPDTSIDEAANIMAEHQIRRLPVIENGILVGIVSLGDLATVKETKAEAGDALSSISVSHQYLSFRKT